MIKKALIISAVFLVFIFSIKAEEYSFSSDDIGDISWNEFIKSLPSDIGDELGESTTDTILPNTDSLREKSTFSYWSEKVSSELHNAIPRHVQTLLTLICGIVMLSAVKLSMPNIPRVTEAFTLCTRLFVTVSIIKEIGNSIRNVSEHLKGICTVMNMFLPVMEAVSVLGGNITEKSVNSASLTIAITLIGNFNTYVLTPLVSALFALSLISVLSEDMGLSGAVASFRQFILRLWQICTILFSFILGIQSVLAKGADDIAAKGAKFVIGSFIPVAGGMLSEAFGTVRSGMNYLREVCGIGGIIVLLLMTLPFIIPLAVHKIVLSVSKVVSDILKCNEVSALINECMGTVDLLIGIALSVELMFLFAILIFVRSS